MHHKLIFLFRISKNLLLMSHRSSSQIKLIYSRVHHQSAGTRKIHKKGQQKFVINQTKQNPYALSLGSFVLAGSLE